MYESLTTIQASVHTQRASIEAFDMHMTEAKKVMGNPVPVSMLTIRGQRVAEHVPQYEDNLGSIGSPTSAFVESGDILLAYPMQKMGTAVLMRRMCVDKHTAQVSWTWVTLYDSGPDGETVFISNFTC